MKLQQETEEDVEVRIIPPEMVKMLTKFEDLFKQPRGLPLKRAQGHAIILLNGTPYLYYQKAKLNGLCKK